MYIPTTIQPGPGGSPGLQSISTFIIDVGPHMSSPHLDATSILLNLRLVQAVPDSISTPANPAQYHSWNDSC
jgi:hypothetical protein